MRVAGGLRCSCRPSPLPQAGEGTHAGQAYRIARSTERASPASERYTDR